ncbi:hypothetical protein XENTR_v10000846 [Xenopus tropicalis]|nr:hypothetical protein XENTR_v10000846 [Xenopus tropicalis]
MDAIGAGVELPRRKILRPKRFREGGEQGELLLGTTRKRKVRYVLHEERNSKRPVLGRVGKVVRRNGATPQDCGRGECSGEGCNYDLRKSHRPWQRRPRRMDQQDNMDSNNFGRASFFFRNREEEESWRQWRKERMGQQMGDGSRIANQQASTSSAFHTVGEERNAGVYTQEAALDELRSLEVLANQDSDTDTSDSETEGGKIVALLKKYFKEGKGKEGDRKRGKEGGQQFLPLGAADTYACALTETAAHLPKKLRKSIETGKFVDVYELTREAVQAKEDGIKSEKEESATACNILILGHSFIFWASEMVNRWVCRSNT